MLTAPLTAPLTAALTAPLTAALTPPMAFVRCVLLRVCCGAAATEHFSFTLQRLASNLVAKDQPILKDLRALRFTKIFFLPQQSRARFACQTTSPCSRDIWTAMIRRRFEFQAIVPDQHPLRHQPARKNESGDESPHSKDAAWPILKWSKSTVFETDIISILIRESILLSPLVLSPAFMPGSYLPENSFHFPVACGDGRMEGRDKLVPSQPGINAGPNTALFKTARMRLPRTIIPGLSEIDTYDLVEITRRLVQP